MHTYHGGYPTISHIRIYLGVQRQMTSALGRWSLGTHAQNFPDCHQQRQTVFGRGAARAARRRLALAQW
jgi:hypothetical protein